MIELTKEQKQDIFRLFLEGLTTKEVSNELSIALPIVKKQFEKIDRMKFEIEEEYVEPDLHKLQHFIIKTPKNELIILTLELGDEPDQSEGEVLFISRNLDMIAAKFNQIVEDYIKNNRKND